MKITIELSTDNLKKAIGLLSMQVPGLIDMKDEILNITSMEITEKTMEELDDDGQIGLGLSLLAVTNFAQEKENKG